VWSSQMMTITGTLRVPDEARGLFPSGMSLWDRGDPVHSGSTGEQGRVAAEKRPPTRLPRPKFGWITPPRVQIRAPIR
jgi:hypothetical protein